MLKHAMLAVLAAGAMAAHAQERGVSFSPNYKGYFHLRTQFTGDELSLEGNHPDSTFMNGAAFMSPQKGASGALWKFVPDAQNAGWYRLKSQHLGDAKCLESNGKESPVKAGAAFMDDCKNVTGQLWRLDLISAKDGNHLYRLRSKLHGNNAALEGNKPGGSAKAGNAFMDKPQNVLGQMWRLNPAQ